MKCPRVLLGLIVILTMATGSAQAESIKGRLGITGRIGVLVPSNDKGHLDTGSSVAVGGGLIFGWTDSVALEVDVVHAPNIGFHSEAGEIESTDVAIGVQFRNNIDKLTAYLGLGVDALILDANESGTTYDVDTVFGGHLRGGGDYFITRNLALNVDLRGSFFPDVDIKNGSTTVATYDPVSFIGMAGVRFFFW